jgi:NAD(P)-dependent dehydrogenase (short-subunit alcohol dehydrogenase family)
MAKLMLGKIALVTGGGSGIGRATALALAREGAKIMIADYVPEGGDRTVKMIKEKGGDASFVHTDVSITKQVEMMVNKTVETYGRIDCALLFNYRPEFVETVSRRLSPATHSFI